MVEQVTFQILFQRRHIQERRRLGTPRRFIEAEYLYEKIVEYGKDHPGLEI